MAEFNFAPRPPKQTNDNPEEQQPSQGQADPQGGLDMRSGLEAAATLIGMARYTTPHIESVNSPSGLRSLLSGVMPKDEKDQLKSDQHDFDLDLSPNADTSGVGSTSTALGAVGEPVRGAAQKESTSSAMRAIAGLSLQKSGNISEAMVQGKRKAKQISNWLSEPMQKMYNIRKH